MSFPQALDAQMVPYLLTLLEGRLDSIDNPGTTKAQIVKALKAMSRSILLGEKVNAILEKSSVWAEYKDQMHDLFISNTPTAGYLTGIECFFFGLIKKKSNLRFFIRTFSRSSGICWLPHRGTEQYVTHGTTAGGQGG